jgi:hypothetical protein
MRPNTWRKEPRKMGIRGPYVSASIPATGPFDHVRKHDRRRRKLRTQENIINDSVDGIHATVLGA